MTYRNLRIAWTVAWCIITLLLIAFWLRSYSARQTKQLLITPKYKYHLHSLAGTVALEREQRIFITVELLILHDEADFLRFKTNAGIKIHRGSDGNIYAVSISCWLLTATAAALAALPWLRPRFSLRTLLIATTLIAVILGLAMYAAR